MALQRREMRKGKRGEGGGGLVGWARGKCKGSQSTVRMDYAKMLDLGGRIPICGCVYYPITLINANSMHTG